MKDYAAYTVEDFITDESYVSYYLQQQEEDVTFWTNWIRFHPEKLDVITSANNYIDALSIRLSEEELEQEQQRFQKALGTVTAKDHFFNDMHNDDWGAFNNTGYRSYYTNPLKIIGLFGLGLMLLISLYFLFVHFMN